MTSPQETDTVIGIDSAGNSAQIKLSGATIASVHIRGDAAATYVLDAKTRDGDWIEDVGSATYSGQSDYDDVIETGMQFLRVRCSSGTAGSGDEATITIGAGG